MAGLSVGMRCLKYAVIAISLLYMAGSMVLIGMGSFVLVKFTEYGPEVQKSWQASPIIVIVVGCVGLLIGFLGCCGASNENYCMLCTFGVILTMVLIAETVAGVLAIMYNGQVEGQVRDYFKKGIADYGKVEEVTKAIDVFQENFHCCGATGAVDYLPALPPKSCDVKYLTVGCVDKVVPYMKGQLTIVATIVFVIIAAQLVVSITALVLAKQIRSYQEV